MISVCHFLLPRFVDEKSSGCYKATLTIVCNNVQDMAINIRLLQGGEIILAPADMRRDLSISCGLMV